MKYCQHCGNELPDEAQICMDCGCPTVSPDLQSAPEPPKKKLSKKKVTLIIVSAILLITFVVGGYFCYDYLRKQAVIDQLVGHKFEFTETQNYIYSFHYERAYVSFLNSNEVEVYWYSVWSDSEPLEFCYDSSYTIDFSKGRTYVNIGSDCYEVIYDHYGNIDALIDIASEEQYDLT